MALEATHIKFALALQERLKAQDLGKFLSGCIYPDSRYFTGVLRTFTHPEDFKLSAKSDDFEKGWWTHLLADHLQLEIFKDWFSGILPFDVEMKAGSPLWIQATALKVLQDIVDAKSFKISEYLQYLNYVQNPLGEDVGILRQYNSVFPEMYKNPESLSVENQYELWIQFGLSDELKFELVKFCEIFQKNTHVIERLPEVFSRMVKNTESLEFMV